VGVSGYILRRIGRNICGCIGDNLYTVFSEDIYIKFFLIRDRGIDEFYHRGCLYRYHTVAINPINTVKQAPMITPIAIAINTHPPEGQHRLLPNLPALYSRVTTTQEN
jgi:hypothetical protein